MVLSRRICILLPQVVYRLLNGSCQKGVCWVMVRINHLTKLNSDARTKKQTQRKEPLTFRPHEMSTPQKHRHHTQWDTVHFACDNRYPLFERSATQRI